MIKIVKVEREKKIVKKVIAIINDYITIKFVRGKDGRPVEVSRFIPGSRLYEPEKLWIPKEIYKKLMRQIYAIFNQKGGKK
ncbi:hypothetical protein J7K86_00240 [bacterium]|nr:hypothetical protein [bacterium]